MLSKNFVTLGGSGPFRIEDNLEELLKYCWYHCHKVKGAHVLHCGVHTLPSMILLKVTAGMETHSLTSINSLAFLGAFQTPSPKLALWHTGRLTLFEWHVDYFILWVQFHQLYRYPSSPVLPFWCSVTARMDWSSFAKKSTSGATVWKISKKGFSWLVTNAKNWNLAWKRGSLVAPFAIQYDAAEGMAVLPCLAQQHPSVLSVSLYLDSHQKTLQSTALFLCLWSAALWNRDTSQNMPVKPTLLHHMKTVWQAPCLGKSD